MDTLYSENNNREKVLNSCQERNNNNDKNSKKMKEMNDLEEA